MKKQILLTALCFSNKIITCHLSIHPGHHHSEARRILLQFMLRWEAWTGWQQTVLGWNAYLQQLLLDENIDLQILQGIENERGRIPEGCWKMFQACLNWCSRVGQVWEMTATCMHHATTQTSPHELIMPLPPSLLCPTHLRLFVEFHGTFERFRWAHVQRPHRRHISPARDHATSGHRQVVAEGLKDAHVEPLQFCEQKTARQLLSWYIID